MAARWRMGPAVRRTSEPPPVLSVSRELDRIRVTHLEAATPMPLTFIANMSVHSTMRSESHATRRVKTDIMRIHARDMNHRARPDSTTLTCACAIARRRPSTPMSIAVTS